MKRKGYFIALCSVFVVVAIGLGVGLGVGLTRNHDSELSTNRDSSASNEDSATTSGAVSTTFVSSAGPTTFTTSSTAAGSKGNGSWWKPIKETTWDYSLQSPPTKLNSSISVYDIDLFDASAEDIQQIQQEGHKVICYFSAGSYENWRPDNSSFDPSDLGNDLDGWEGEKWLNISSASIRSIMVKRIEKAVDKNCDGIDPDNLDGYDNSNGLGLTEEDSVDYISFLSKQAHSRNLSIGLKNCGSIVGEVVDLVEWVVQEQCIEYDDCDDYQAFIDNDKPVFNVEYPKGDKSNSKNISEADYYKICHKSAKSFSTILKNMDLDSWIESCPL